MSDKKFKAWNPVLKTMSEPFSIEDICYKGAPHVMCAPLTGEYDPAIEIKLLQFTTFKDRNGKEIYEGDIIVLREIIDRGDGWADDDVGQVIVKSGAFLYSSYNQEDWLVFAVQNDTEIIGNIYENPELLGHEK